MIGGIARALRPTAPLFLWGAHFGLIYAIHSFACERGFVEARMLGMPFVQALVAGVTVLALLGLALLAWAPLARMGLPEVDGGEEEPRFRLWLLFAACCAAALTILFQAAPAFVLPAC
ncbi:hypothetical protein [Sabulicella glaciei]|uniref:Uncharacterized protein n=1 Tax=Sabulicella glaciei TaxID=2984948 RepID=A0ABT3NSE0_9PROT|nr:hypothetical protein [Roseococcus sp. MDT2-1-1]MCW8084788.1 hypothetical protein [Roseococcus sp. MDT2-1-1]